MSGNGRRRERSATVSGSALNQQRNSGTSVSVASSSTRQEQMRDATLAAEEALRRYQQEMQQSPASFPYQVQRQSPPSQHVRHASATVSSASQLQRIPEVNSESSSGEAAGREARNSTDTPRALRAGDRAGATVALGHGRSVSMGDNYGALPRNFDPVTGRKQAPRGEVRRPSLPYVFSPMSQGQPQQAAATERGDFPNPHGAGPSDSQLSTAQLQRRASQEMQSPLLSRHASGYQQHQRSDNQTRSPPQHVHADRLQRDIPPTPPLGSNSQPSGFQTMPLSINKARQSQPQAQAPSTSSVWSSETESEPTPTASSVAAMRERNAQLESQLLPVQLTLPSTFSSSSTLAPNPLSAQQAVISGTRFGLQPSPQQQQRQIPVAVSAAEVASIKASAAPFAPATPSKLSAPPIRSSSNDTNYSGDTIALPDGTQIPTVRTDFQNLKRISLPKPAGTAANVAVEKPKQVQPEAVASVGGHVLSRADAKVVARNDGSSRMIYSPTPQTLAAARRQSTLLQVPAAAHPGGETRVDHRIPSPLSASVEAPTAPQIPHALKFHKSEPLISTPPQEPQSMQAEVKAADVASDAVGKEGKSVSGMTQAKSDDTDVRKRDNDVGFRGDPRRNTFGELAPSMLEEANRKLFVYQMQQLDDDAREKGVGSSRQHTSVPTSGGTAPREAARKSKESSEKGGQTDSIGPQAAQIVRRESSASQRSRRDSIGSATTAFDSPTKEDFPSGLFRQSSGSGGAKGARGTARIAVAPPSDVPEMQEPEDAEAPRSEDDEGTEIDEQDEPFDLSLEKRVPFIVDTYASSRDADDFDMRALRHGQQGEKGEFRFIPISSVKAGKARRPRTRDTRVSFRSNPSHIDQPRPGSRQHGAAPACRQCFRAGFDCAMNLQLGEGTAARKAFQDFVAAGGLNAISIRDGAAPGNLAGSIADSQGGRGSITVEEALGRNYVDKLGEVAFGESALSRPVTRGMYNELLEEKQEQERRRQMYTDHKPWAADVDSPDHDDIAKQKHSSERVKRSLSSNRDRRHSQMTLQDGVDDVEPLDEDEARQVLLSNLRRSGSQKQHELEEGEVVDIDPADYEDEADLDDETLSSASEDDPVVWADRWSAAAKLRQLLAYWVYLFALQALASGYTNTVGQIIADQRADGTAALLLGIGSLAYNGSQGGGLFFANALVGFGRQRITLLSLVAVGGVCTIAGFVHHFVPILAVQSLLGLLAGVATFLALATVMDVFATSKGRLFGVGSMTLALVGGQIAGPWISKLVLSLLSWSWTYWLTLIVAAVLIVYMGVATRETSAFVVFRREALRLKRTGQGWTPEPQPETQARQAFVDDLGRPVRLVRYNPMLVLLAIALAALTGMYMFLFSGLQRVFTGTHGLSSTSAALAITVSAALGLTAGVVTTYVVNSRRVGGGAFVTKSRPLYLDEKGHIDTHKPLRVKTETLLVPGVIAGALFSFALYTLALTASFATTWLLTAFSVVLATASVVCVGLAVVQYVLDGYSPARKVVLRDVVAREDVSTPTLLQDADEDRFTSYSRRTAGRLAAARFNGGRNGRHGLGKPSKTAGEQSEGEREAWLDAGEGVVTSRDKRWLDETALAAMTAVVVLVYTISCVLSFAALVAYSKLSFGAYAVIFASVALLLVLMLVCVYLYGAKPRARSLLRLDEADGERAHSRRAAERERRALQRRRSISQSQATSEDVRRFAPARLAKRLADALGYRPLSQDGLEVYRRDDARDMQATRAAPVSVMHEADRHSAATAAAEGRRELWLAKFIASRNEPNPRASTPPGQDDAAPTLKEARGIGNGGLKETVKGWGGVMLGRPSPNAGQRDALGRTHNAMLSAFNSPPRAAFPLSPPPPSRPRASVTLDRETTHADGDGFEIVQFEARRDQRRPYTPVLSRKSVDMTRSRTDIMARSHSHQRFASGQH
ncbi:uncharacterized protein PSANT_00152 [Moesziomyces antarcticus]|uniref:Major facilitator superfamily (MFS) profile domain-containing protein n=1 Tax=Pseudozyma antarctica TaxID=84753 RepID=A0A5C3FGJ1_PSEA2|nr:uncharacterized protein PSANT_00152 [Moesziomyces antarcticus]